MDIKKLIDVILTSLNDGKATNIDVYDIKKMTSMPTLLQRSASQPAGSAPTPNKIKPTLASPSISP